MNFARRSVGKPVPHESAAAHVRGEAPYVDDWTPVADELFVSFVGSPVAAGLLKQIDLTAAKEVAGFMAAFTVDDVPGHNQFGPVVQDEPFLADRELLYLGQPVVVVAAESPESLQAVRRAVRIEADASDLILTIEQALDQQLFLGPARRIRRGDPNEMLAHAPHRLNGVFFCDGQEQFYLESQAAIAYPVEQDQLIVHSSTQNPTEIQAVVADVLGLGQHQVVCVCRRMGGAFGGKETQAALPALMAALVAQRLRRPARVVYNKDDDMCVTGKRHAYRAEWDVGFDNDGRIEAMKVNFFSNGGAATDLSLAVMERSMLHAENTYYIPHIEIQGRVCFTNLPPNTAFRGFGGPQAMAAMENVIENIAQSLDTDAYDVRIRNLYGVGNRNVTPYGQIIQKNHLPEIFASLASQAHYKQRRRQIAQANATDPLRLRGIALTGVKFGISFTTRFLNQANALVNIYTDGTVQVSTGGTEMGQGLHTKIQQLVADEFSISADTVMVMPTSTEKNNNTSPTAASAGTDLNGAAAVAACRKIKRRLRQFAAAEFVSDTEGLTRSPRHVRFENGFVTDGRNPARRVTFADLVSAARRERVDLGARGFYATPGVDFNRETGRGTPFLYFTQGAAVAEVEIDRFTGEVSVSRADLLIDIGQSINPGVDRGQITGGFVQGMGWVTMEALIYDEQGALLSHSPTTYKIPAITDVPLEFHCALFPNDDNHDTVRRSKAVGEPPLMLGISVWAAIRHALSCAGQGQPFDLAIPATAETVLLTLDQFTRSEAFSNATAAVSDEPSR